MFHSRSTAYKGGLLPCIYFFNLHKLTLTDTLDVNH